MTYQLFNCRSLKEGHHIGVKRGIALTADREKKNNNKKQQRNAACWKWNIKIFRDLYVSLVLSDKASEVQIPSECERVDRAYV